MIIRSHSCPSSRVQLVVANGDSIALRARDLFRFFTSRRYFGFALLFTFVLTILLRNLFGQEIDFYLKTAVVAIGIVAWAAIWLAQFWLIERFAMTTKQCLVVITLGLHVLPLIITMRAAGAFVGWYIQEPAFAASISLSYYVGFFVIAWAFEFCVASWIWPSLARRGLAEPNGQTAYFYGSQEDAPDKSST